MASITLLGPMGDVVFTWDDDNEAAMLEYIENKLKSGYTFFLIETKDNLTHLTPTTNLDAIKLAKTVRMADEDKAVLASGTAQLARVNPTGSTEELGAPVRDAKEIVKKNTVAVKRVTAG